MHKEPFPIANSWSQAIGLRKHCGQELQKRKLHWCLARRTSALQPRSLSFRPLQVAPEISEFYRGRGSVNGSGPYVHWRLSLGEPQKSVVLGQWFFGSASKVCRLQTGDCPSLNLSHAVVRCFVLRCFASFQSFASLPLICSRRIWADPDPGSGAVTHLWRCLGEGLARPHEFFDDMELM